MAIMRQSPVITDGVITGVGADWHDLTGEKRDIDHEKWLDDTQNMRVVALNEACALAKAAGTGDSQTIVRMASIFADYLIRGRV